MLVIAKIDKVTQHADCTRGVKKRNPRFKNTFKRAKTQPVDMLYTA